ELARVPAPMPRLVCDAMAIPARIRHPKPETRRMPLQPRERRRALELFLERRVARRRQVDRAPGMVLAVAGRRADAEDLGHVEPALALSPHDAELVVGRAVRR